MANDFSLSFKKHSSSKIWRVKKDWNQSIANAGMLVVETLDNWRANSDEIQSNAKVGKSVDENLDVHSVSLDFDPLANLKQIRLSNSLDDNFFSESYFRGIMFFCSEFIFEGSWFCISM